MNLRKVSEMEEHIRTSDSNSMLSSNLGRVMNTLLTARPKKLEDAISRLGSGPQKSAGSLEEPLCFLRNYVSDAAANGETLDQILVPMIENSLKSKDSRHCNQVFVLLNWLFKYELIFQALSIDLAKIIRRKDDRYITLGWCTLICGLVDFKTTTSLYSNTGIQEKHKTLLLILFTSVSHLSSILCNGSVVQGGFELPTRLAVAAADCILVLTEASTKKSNDSEVSNVKMKTSEPDMTNQLVALSSTASDEKKGKSSSRFQEDSEKMEVDVLLWDHMDELIILVQRLMVWSRKSRPLHAKGLEQVLKWLHEIKGHCSSVSVKAGGNILKTGVSLLSSCWKHYSMLLRLEDHRFSQHYSEMLHQYISGIQFYMDGHNEHSEIKDSGLETRKFFLISITLLLGRLDSKQFGVAMSEHGLQISRLLLSQLECLDEDVIEMAASILRETMFKTNYALPDRTLIDTEQMETVFPLLLSLLDERDTAARAVVMLTAEYCSLNADGQCLQEIFKRLAAQNLLQRRNAIDIISELLHISNSRNSVSHSVRQAIAQNLLGRLADDEPAIRVQASNLLAAFDPPLILPELVRLVYSPYQRVRTSSSNTLVEVLKSHHKSPDVIIMLIDCLSKLCQQIDLPDSVRGKVEGSKIDSDDLLKLIPHWSKSVQDWNIHIGPLVDKMFAEPSNAVIVRFLSYISENLAEAQDMVLHRVLLYMQGQKEVNEKLSSSGVTGTYKCNESIGVKDNLFCRLCPLLIIRLLPLKVFDDLNSAVMYGQFLKDDASHGGVSTNFLYSNNEVSIATILVTRAFDKFEFEDVRKLAAELCGRVHPQVLFPIIRSQLEHATYSRDVLKMKACLFALCTSLVLRGSVSAHHPVLLEIRTILEMVLLWPSLDGDEVSKAQHGCIDCLALMICAELQTPDSFKEYSDDSSENSVLNYVIQNLIHVRTESNCSSKISSQSHLESKSSDFGCESRASFPISFHLCMANVLISACQKISISGKIQLAGTILPVLIRSVGMIKDSEVSAACIQVLFSAVYHLKSAILPHSCDLLKLSIKALKKGSHKEKMASVKLMASLMASEDVVIGSISGGLLEARSVVSNISLTDRSMELREVCKQLLECLTSPLVFRNFSV